MSKLYDVMGIARWGVECDEGVDFEECHRNGTTYMAYTGYGSYDVLWDTEKEGRYPSVDEFEAIEASIR